MKAIKKSLLPIIIAVVFILFILSLVLIINIPKLKPKTNIVFYNLTQSQEQCFTEVLKKQEKNKKDKTVYKFISIKNKEDSSASLKDILPKKTDLVITLMGKTTDELALMVDAKKASSVYFDESILNGTTISVHDRALKALKDKIAALPLLMDAYEIDIDLNVKNYTHTQEIATWNDLENFIKESKSQIENPVVFTGGIQNTLLDIAGALTETFGGKQNYNEIIDRTNDFINTSKELNIQNTEDFLDSLVKDNGPLYDAVKVISSWKAQKIVNNEIFRFKDNDLQAFMTNRNAAVVFMTLSQHRAIKQNIINRYCSIPETCDHKTVYFPSYRKNTQRYVISPVICAVPLTKNAQMHEAVKYLISSEGQEALCRSTGLAPVLANCKVPDIQSDDLRFLIAATNAPLLPLSSELFTDNKTKQLFTNALINILIKYSFN